ncbi:uncharacterized protein LOC117498040 isoform X2 [Trematomus bernacchii]|nr:uncharacterized protein LOC117498040 isoform X2 [Trematomus bernacchii]XP_034005976.1 uncharacterized protein LOC117498040 isoform X2 [Trematomus bernacchii]
MASNITTTISQQSSSSSVPLSINDMVGIAILTLAFVLGFPGNLFVVWTVLCRMKMRSVTCLLVLNLSMADAFLLLSAPFFLHYLAGGRGWEFGSAACKLVHYLSSVNMYVSIYLICLMSMDRWLAVSRPFQFQKMRTKRSLLIILLVVWVLALLLSLPMPFYRRLEMRSTFPNNITLSFCVPYHWKSKGHRVFQYLFETIMSFLLPFSLIITCNSSVICRLQSAKFQCRAEGSRLILMVICTFAVFWLPYHIVNIIEAFLMASNITTTISQKSSSSSVPLSINDMVGIAILTLAFVLGFPGNLFVVWTVLCLMKKRSVTCLLVLNLSMADAFLLLSAPFFLRYLAGGRGWEFGSAACKLVHYLSSVNMYVSIYLICLMSMDRWLAVSRPFLFHTMRTKCSLLILLLVVWMLALLLSVPMPFYRRLEMRSTFPNNITLSFCVPYHWKSKSHRVFQYLFETIVGFLLPFSLINTCNSSVICRLQSAKFQRRPQGSRLILMVICTFAVFWLPYHIVNIIEAFLMASNITTTISQQSSSSSVPLSINHMVGIAILTLAFVLGFPGNLFVVWTVLCRVKKRSVTCLLVLNLSMADAFLLLSAPFFLRYLAGGRGWEFGSAACKLVHYLSSVNMYVSIYLICLMSMDRWLAVSRPFLFHTMRTKCSLLILLLVVWMLALLLSVPMPFYRSNLKKTFPNNITLSFCVPYHWKSKGHRVFQYLFETIMACLLPFSLINTCYSSVICRLQSAKFQRRAQGSHLILMVICTFAVFWLPYHIVNIIEAFLMASNITTTISQQSSSSSVPLSISHIVGIAILTLAFVLGFPGNLFVVWTVLCRVKKRSVTCLLVLNLSMADAFVLLSAPLFLRYLAGGRGWEFGSAACKLVHYLSSVNMYVSIYLICLMSMDRWLAVSRPFLSQRMRTKRSLLILLLAVWVLAFLMSLPMPFYRSNLEKTLPNNITLRFCMPYHWRSKGHRVFQYLFETIMACLLPFSLINTCYTSVICRLQSAKFQRRAQGSRLILMIICTFAVFWLPYHIVNIIEVVGLLHNSTSTVNAALAARPNVTAFAYFSSAINPILYVFAGSSHIRKAGLSFMGKLFEATNSESRTTSTFARSGRISRSSSSPDESSVLNTLSIKLGRPFKSKHKDRSDSVAGKEADEPELRTLASQLN